MRTQHKILLGVGLAWSGAGLWALRPFWPAQDPSGGIRLPALAEVLAALLANLPLVLLTAVGLAGAVAVVGVMVRVLETWLTLRQAEVASRVRILAAEAASAEATARQRQAQTADLTLQEGRIVPRLVRAANGKLTVVNAGLGTAPVQEIDPDVAAGDSERLRSLAILAQHFGVAAAVPAAPGGTSHARGAVGGSLETLALVELLRDDHNGAVNGLPGLIRVLEATEVPALPVNAETA